MLQNVWLYFESVEIVDRFYMSISWDIVIFQDLQQQKKH